MTTPLRTNVEKKQQKILDTALQVFAKEGFRNTDVQVIADMASVGKGTIYRHFGNKKQLFLATSKYCLDQAGNYIRQELGSEDDRPKLQEKFGTLGVLREIALAYARFYQRRPEAVEIMIQERAEFRESVVPSHLMDRAETREDLDELVRSASEQGEIRAVEPKQLVDAYADLLYGTVVNGCLEGGRSGLVARMQYAVDLFLHGLASQTQ